MKGLLTLVLFHCIKIAATQDSPCSSFPLPTELYCNETSKADSPCSSFPLPTELYFKETSKAERGAMDSENYSVVIRKVGSHPVKSTVSKLVTLIGSILFVSNETNSTIQEWRFRENNPRVALNFENQTYQFTLQSEVNLDVISVTDICNSQLQQFTQTISCDRPGEGPTDIVVTFHVLPVNEFKPEFSGDDGINIIEGNKTTPYFIERLFDRFIDKDCPKEHINLNIINSAGSESDVSEYFMINKTSGFLFQIKTFDYEDTSIQCQLGKGGGVLNITAEDGVHVISKVLSVTFVDVDDSPPVFVNARCSTTCYTCPVSALYATIQYSDTGYIITDPTDIKALDPDSNSTNVIYNMEVDPEIYKDNIVFENGTFILLHSFLNFSGFHENFDFNVMVVLQAIDTNGQKSDKLKLTINVHVPVKIASSNSSKDIIIAVLATLVGICLCLVAVVIGFYKIRMKYHRAKTSSIEKSYEVVSKNNETKENFYDTIK